MRVAGARAGFTLIELMIVVAIIGLLAAIAIPNFIQMQLRSKRSELPTNLAAIRTVEGAYFQSFDTYTACGTNPSGDPTTAQRDWEERDDWNLLGYKPDGKVRGSYTVDAGNVEVNAGPSDLQKGLPTAQRGKGDEGEVPALTSYSAYGVADVDGDGEYCEFSASQEISPTLVTGNNIY